MRIGIFGGSFDPVHLGHLWIGEAASESLSLDELRWIPAATQPLKPGGAVASDTQRLEMLRLAIAGRSGHLVDDREIRRQGVSYTVDTVEEIWRECRPSELFLVVGSDSVATMDRWHEPRRLLARVILAVVQRGGEDDVDFDSLADFADADRIERFRRSVIPMPQIELSSSEIRSRVGQGRSIRYRVPRAVESYIESAGLYRQ